MARIGRALVSLSLVLGLACSADGQLAIDGDASDWDTLGDAHRIHPGLHNKWTNQARLYGKFEGNSYFFHLVPAVDQELFDSTIYFNLDENQTTTSKANNERFDGSGPPGYELYAVINTQGAVIYSGCAPFIGEDCRTLVQSLPSSGTEFAILEDNSIEFRIKEEIFGGGGKDIEIAVVLQSRDLEGSTTVEAAPPFLLNYYSMYGNLESLLTTSCASATPGNVRAAILFDELAQASFFQDKAYTQLFLALQHQIRQSGMPHDRLTLTDLLNVQDACKYTAIVVPALTYVRANQWPAVKKAVFTLTQVYGVGFVISGEFMSNSDQNRTAIAGDPYFAMAALLGIKNDFPVGAKTTKTELIVESQEEMFQDVPVGTVVLDNSTAGVFTLFFIQPEDSAFETIRVAKQTVSGVQGDPDRNGILASQIQSNLFGRASGRIVHFATSALVANQSLVWRALRWIAKRNTAVNVGLVISRFSGGIFTCRNDMDQTKFIKTSSLVTKSLYTDAIVPWYQKYNFVSSYYVNIGNDIPGDEFTDWTRATADYLDYLSLENEIGSHTYTHPFNISALNSTELDFEIGDSLTEIASALGLDRIAAAQPGIPEDLRTAIAIEKYSSDTYFSGGFSGVNAGYPGAFGKLTPKSEMVYVAPNMKFDFSLELLNISAEGMGDVWIDEIDYLSNFSNSQVFHWPIHDYSVTELDDQTLTIGGGTAYSFKAFDRTIAYAREKNVEFATVLQLSDRIRTHEAASLVTTVVSDTQVLVTVSLSQTATEQITLGNQALQVEDLASSQFITSVAGHFAFTDRYVFLPSQGGTFRINLGSKEEAFVTGLSLSRITDLDMRMELVFINGNGEDLNFVVRGRGTVKVSQNLALSPEVVLISSDVTPVEDWSSDPAKRGLEFTFTTDGTHQVSITRIVGPVITVLPTPAPVLLPTTRSPTRAAESRSPTSRPTGNAPTPPLYHRCSQRSNYWENRRALYLGWCNLLSYDVAIEIRLTECDLERPGALAENNSIALLQACPDLAGSAVEDDFYSQDAEDLVDRAALACSQICAAAPTCSRWTLNKETLECFPLDCFWGKAFTVWDSNFVSGTPCYSQEET